MQNSYPSEQGNSHCFGRAAMVLAASLLAAISIAAPASAAAPEFLWQTPPDSIFRDSGAGQLDNPRGIAADPDSGHLYVAELSNSRISEFTAWGTFVKAWGWDVAPDGAPGDTAADELEICTTVCKVGIPGNGAGQINDPHGITIDAAGDLYVAEGPLDNSSKRVQKFSPAGQFLLMFGGQVNKTKVQLRQEQEANSEPVTVTSAEENLCTAASGDTCGSGTSGAADGQFSSGNLRNYLTYNPQTDSIFVGDVGRIQEFNLDGTFKSKIELPGETVSGLAAGPNGNLFYLLAGKPDVRKVSPTGAPLTPTFPVGNPVVLAVDASGSVYVVDDPGGELAGQIPRVLGFDSAGKPITGMEPGDSFAVRPEGTSPRTSGLATNAAGPGSGEPGNLYVGYFGSFATDPTTAFINAYGPPPLAFEDPPLASPEIESQFAVSVDTDGAMVRARINPHFWPDTTFRVQYGTEGCVEGGWDADCVSELPPGPGTVLTSGAINSVVSTSGVFLEGLEQNTAYRYRFVARSTGSGSEDVIGVGGEPSLPGADAGFTTFPAGGATGDACANQDFRAGQAAKLPDCRAYELVSPLDKGNTDVIAPRGAISLDQSSTSGSRFTYTTATSFGAGALAAPTASQYLAQRDPVEGWATSSLSQARTREIPADIINKLRNEFKLFSPDLCSAWLRTPYDPPLTADAISGQLNLYRRQNCGGEAGLYEALTTVAPPHASPHDYGGLEVQGVSADGSVAIYGANDKLTPEAPANPGNTMQLYERGPEGQLSFACILPNGNPLNPAASSCSAGTGYDREVGEGNSNILTGALSADGRRVFWTAGPVTADSNPSGRIYVRVDGAETVPVSQSVSVARAVFWGADVAEGARAIFQITDSTSPLDRNLYSFDVDSEQETLIAAKTFGVLGMSEDATRVYFASEEALLGAGQNSEEDEAQPGEPNLYLWVQGEGPTFIGTLADGDTTSSFAGKLSPLSPSPATRLARVSPDGLHAVFMSTASLTGYDNVDADTGGLVNEVFLYDAEEGELRCASCNRSGARPHGDELKAPGGGGTGVFASGQIPTWQRSLYPTRVLSEDGARLFFESFEALVPRDTNGVKDVYAWQEAGSSDCDEGDAAFNPEAGGCVELISSGQSPRPSSFLDASPNGSDVFFSTLSSLLPQDYGLVDIYDARVGGGFPQPATVPGCEGEACQGPISAPNDPTPASSAFEGAGNVVEEKPSKPRCPRGKVRRSGRCLKPKPHKAKHKKAVKRHGRGANHDRRAAR